MRVLVLSYETPAYPGGGGESRQHCLLEPLAERHEIRLLTTGGPPRFGSLPKGVDVRFVEPRPPHPVPSGPWWPRNREHYLHGPPWLHHLAAHEVDALTAPAMQHLAEFSPDLVQIEHGELGPLLQCLPPGSPTVLVLHNMLTTIQAQLARGSLKHRLTMGLETLVMAARERRDLRAATSVVVVTESDRRLARRMGRPQRLHVVPNCIPAAYFARTADSADRPTMVFTASFSYEPNRVAARELLTEVFPRVRAAVPQTELVLVGHGMPDDLAATVASTPGARATGPVDDVRPELHRAWLAMAPLRQGSGSPLKVMEALASGVPVVATARVARALGVAPEDGVLSAVNAGGLAEAAVRLLRDPALRRRVAERGPAVARERFDRGPAARLQEAVWEQTLSVRRR